MNLKVSSEESTLHSPFTAAWRGTLLAGALPGEVVDFAAPALDAAAAFIAEVAQQRAAGIPAIALRSLATEAETERGVGTGRRMWIAIVNDDMPFLVDSVAGTLGAFGIGIHRLLHPVISVRRTASGELTALGEGEQRESIIFIEASRADARVRNRLLEALEATLADVRAAVADWRAMQDAIAADAATLPAEAAEEAALLRWFGEGHLTLLGHRHEHRDDSLTDALGILRTDPAPLWSDRARAAAFAWFDAGHRAPLLVKAKRDATVHRRVALDLVVVPVVAGGKVAALSVHAGLWTSAALRAAPEAVPLLRARLAAIEARHGFHPAGHAGKALRHALGTLPHDLTVSLAEPDLETLALTAMSLADRPRPKLVLAPAPFNRHLFAFVWIPRDELNTARREAIEAMIAKAAEAPLINWSIELGDGQLARLCFTFDLVPGAALPDAGALDAALEAMLRGWQPAVEAALSAALPAGRATRLVIGHAPAFPLGYRDRYAPEEAAADILRLAALKDDEARGARLYRLERDGADRLRLKLYRKGGLVPLSSAVPTLENFGFGVLKEVPTRLGAPVGGHLHEFLLTLDAPEAAADLLARAAEAEGAIVAVLEGRAENDPFNQLITGAGLDPRGVLLLRAWFRYMRQAGLAYGIQTVVDALKRAPAIARALIALFDARHDPSQRSEAHAAAADATIEQGLGGVAAIDDDRILRWFRAFVHAVLRTNAFAPAASEALAFKLDSSRIPGLPQPLPWREIWVYSPRIEGIHLRGGPVARGGLRWSDRRDDFRTEILGLMKAQLVKNAVIVPTGAKGGFYPKQLPNPAADRDAWIAEGTESYRIFIRTLLSVTDNIVDGAVIHPEAVAIHDGEDPYFVVAADKGTATFSDVANAIAVERGFWLGDAFASGGSVGYDHKAMGITAKGAWISVQRHFAEMGIDVQTQSVRVAGCGDMSGDVFGNGMLLSKAIKLVAAFDHRHIFLDPDPDPAKSWDERARLFALPRSSWEDYDKGLISKGGGVFARSLKSIPLSPEIRAMLGLEVGEIEPSALIQAILRAEVDLIWFGGIGTYVKARAEAHAKAGDTANDANRVDAEDLRAKVIGEGANLGVTQGGRIAFALGGGRINTDFIDNSAGVDCSDNEVNIKIPLNREMIEGRLGYDDRNALLKAMTDDVATLVLEDNRLQTLALSLSERGGAEALPSHLRIIDMLEARGRINRAVEGLGSNEELNRRLQDGHGLTRPELAVLLSHTKLALQAAIEGGPLADDPLLVPTLHAAFPPAMRARFSEAIDAHRLRGEIIATKLANRIVNRLGFAAPLELGEEEGASLAMVAGAYVAVDAIFGVEQLWTAIEAAPLNEDCRLDMLASAAEGVRLHVADLLRSISGDEQPSTLVEMLAPGIGRLDAALEQLLRPEAIAQATALRARLAADCPDGTLVDRIVRLHELDGTIGNAMLARACEVDVVALTQAYVRLGEALGLDWARAAVVRFHPADGWERLLAAGLGRDFEQLRLDFLARLAAADPAARDPRPEVERWLEAHQKRVWQFRELVDRARIAPAPNAAMLAQIASQARLLLTR